jgi:uncharacterized protein YbaR (Trm112 family)
MKPLCRKFLRASTLTQKHQSKITMSSDNEKTYWPTEDELDPTLLSQELLSSDDEGEEEEAEEESEYVTDEQLAAELREEARVCEEEEKEIEAAAQVIDDESDEEVDDEVVTFLEDHFEEMSDFYLDTMQRLEQIAGNLNRGGWRKDSKAQDDMCLFDFADWVYETLRP